MLLNSSKKSTYILLISVSVHFFGRILLACFLTIFLPVPSQVEGRIVETTTWVN
jgi:hypothetical protein